MTTKEGAIMEDNLLVVENVSKIFGATKALTNASLAIKKGIIHSLLGRNGAGKSTLVNIIAGIHKQTNGKVFLEGKEITPLSVFERQKLGVKIVPQHASVIPDLTVGENIFMGVWPKAKCGLINWRKLYYEAELELKKYGLDERIKDKVGSLSGVAQRKVNIIRAMYGGAKLIILDEPTTALSSIERQELFAFVNELKETGTSFIFISHYLQEAVELSDEITVLRDGFVFPVNTDGTYKEESLANLIAGETIKPYIRKTLPYDDSRDIVLECKHISGPVLKDVSVKLYKGEITGLVGFPGSGARELCRTIFGLEKKHEGTIDVNGRTNVNISCPYIAMRNGITYLSYDRHKEGIIKLMSIVDNISIPLLNSILKRKSGLIDIKKAVMIAQNYFDALHIKATTVFDKLKSLSGGNQQKVVVAKTLSSNPQVLLLDEPTIGIDVKSREEIIETINSISSQKETSVLYLSNDFDELIRTVDRVLFFQDGMLMRDIRNEGLTHEDIINIRDSVKEEANRLVTNSTRNAGEWI